MEVEQADVGEAGCDDEVRRLTGHAAARDADLHDVEAGGDDVQHGRSTGLGVLEPETTQAAAHPVADEADSVRTALANEQISADEPCTQVDGDDHVGAHRARERDGHGIHEGAVDENPIAAHHRREQAGHRKRCAHCVQRRACPQPNLGAGLERRGDGGEGNREILDRPVLTHAADERHESLAFQQPAAHGDVHERNDVAAAHTASPGAEAVEFAGGVGRAD